MTELNDKELYNHNKLKEDEKFTFRRPLSGKRLNPKEFRKFQKAFNERSSWSSGVISILKKRTR